MRESLYICNKIDVFIKKYYKCDKTLHEITIFTDNYSDSTFFECINAFSQMRLYNLCPTLQATVSV